MSLENFFKDYKKHTELIDSEWRMYKGSVKVKIFPWDNFCYIHTIIATIPRRGLGSLFFRLLIELSNKHNVVLLGRPLKIEETSKLTNEKLEKWYSSMGCQVYKPIPEYYVRYPDKENLQKK